MGEKENRCSSQFILGFSERVSHFSLDFWLIRPLDSFGPRRKAVLRGEDNAWTPVLRSIDKIHDVGDLSYLVYFRFKCFVDDSGGLRPSTAEVLKFMELMWTVRDCPLIVLGLLVYNLCYKLYCGVHEAGNGHGIWVHKVEPMLGSGREQ